MSKVKICVKKISKRFGTKKVLRKLNLNIFESESLAIIGESGSGKSVLTRCIIGLTDFDEGTIIFDKILNINKLSDREKNQYIAKFGILFQNSALLDSLTVKDNLYLANKNNNYNKILNQVSLPKNILNKFPADLSVGVQKRVGLARAILKNPDVLILDEPTTGLDPIISRQINLLIKRLVKENKITTITVTHDMESVYEFADAVAFIKDGNINWYGKPSELKKKANKPLKNFINGIY